MASIPTRIAAQPNIISTYVGQVTSARTITGFSNNLVHLSGFRGMRFIQQICEVKFTTSNDIPPVGPMLDQPRMRWVVSPMARWVWWGCFYAAEAKEGTNVPDIDVKLQDPAVPAVIIDRARWTEARGNLITNRYRSNANFGQRGQLDARDEFIHTGWSNTAVNFGPHLLDLKGLQGLDVEIVVDTNFVRIFSMFALEIAEGVV